MSATFPLNIKISASLTNALKNLTKLEKKLFRVSKAATKVGTSLSLKVTAPLAGLGAASIRSAANLETISVAFESLTGSAENAQKTVKELVDFTARTPFQLEQVSGAARQLLAAGFATTELSEELMILGDIAAGANIPLNDMASIFVKIRNKQKAQAEEINQLSERGIPIIQALAKQLGVAESKIFELSSKGKISFELIRDALSDMRSEGGIFANQMERQSRTLAGVFSTLKDNVNLAGAAFGDALARIFGLKEGMKDLVTVINNLRQRFVNLSPEKQEFIVKVALAVAAIGPLLLILGQLGFAIVGIIAATTALIPVVAALSKVLMFLALNPVGMVIAGLGAMLFLFGKLWHMAGELGTAFKAAFLGLASLVMNQVLPPIQKVLSVIIAGLDKIGISVPNALRQASNFSFDDYASTALSRDLDLSRSGGRSQIDVNFNNTPAETRVTSDSDGLELATDVGYQLGTP